MKKIMSDLDYIELYAKKLKEDNSIFKQQKNLIESQLKASQSLFSTAFGEGEEFKKNARKHLRNIGLIQ